MWCPKYRRRVIDGPIEERLEQLIRGVCDERDAHIVELETMPDHVHLLVSCDPQLGIHRLVKQIKGHSSRVLRAESPGLESRLPTLWTNSYFVATVGDATLEVVKRYVENQKNAELRFLPTAKAGGFLGALSMISGPTEEHEQLSDLVRRFLAEKSGPDRMRALAESGDYRDEPVWRQLADQLMLPGIAVPQQYGGAGYGPVELSIVLAETGRALLVSPYFSTVALAGQTLTTCTDETVREQWLPRIADGSATATLAVADDTGAVDPGAVRTTAERLGDGWQLTGTKRFVIDGSTADLLLVAAVTGGETALFAVDGTAEGMRREPLPSLDPTRPLATVHLAATPATRIAGDTTALLARVADLVAVALAAEQSGGAAAALDMAVEYAKVRVQFDRPIGSFQAIKHRCADLLLEVESARAAVFSGAQLLAQEDPEGPVAAAVAAVQAGRAFTHAAKANIQIHGGIGFTWEHDAHFYLERAKSSELLLGTVSRQRARIPELAGFYGYDRAQDGEAAAHTGRDAGSAGLTGMDSVQRSTASTGISAADAGTDSANATRTNAAGAGTGSTGAASAGVGSTSASGADADGADASGPQTVSHEAADAGAASPGPVGLGAADTGADGAGVGAEKNTLTSTGDEDFRLRLRTFLRTHSPGPRPRDPAERVAWTKAWHAVLVDHGYAGPSWPREYGGMDLPFRLQVIYQEETTRARVPSPLGTGLGIVAPTIIRYGTEEQKQRWLRPMLRGDMVWCQGYSEPGAGSDLPALRTTARRDGTDYIVNGQKVWTSGATLADMLFCLVRTGSTESRHKGITYLIIDAHAPGVTIRPLRDLTGSSIFAEVFFDDVRVPAHNRIGAENEGWPLVRTSLGHERAAGAMNQAASYRRILDELVALARDRGHLDDPLVRDRLTDFEIRVRLIRYNAERTISAILAKGEPGAGSSVSRLLIAEFEQELHEFAVDMLGPDALVTKPSDQAIQRGRWTRGFLMTRASTIGAGTTEIQRNTIAEQVLRLPHDPAMPPR